MKFRPATEEECLNLLPEGEYKFYVKHAEETVSKKSCKPMIKLTLAVIDTNNNEHMIFDYLMEAMPRKMRHFCYAAGLELQYEQGDLNDFNCKDKSGVVVLGIEKSPGYNPKNNVLDYLKDFSNKEAEESKPPFDDDVPF